MKHIFVILLVTLLATGCSIKNENVALKAEIESLTAENALLSAGDLDMELSISEYRAMLVEIDKNLAGIDEKSGKVKTMAAGGDRSAEDDIKLHLEHIHGTMTNTKHKIAHLQNNLDELYLNEELNEDVILALEMELDDAADEIFIRDIAIDDLNDVVIEQDIDIDALSQAYVEQAVLSEVLYGALNTAYLVIGTKKELLQYGVIDKQGGFLGLGKVKSLAAEANDGLFQPLSIDETETIAMQYKKAKLLTTHPESSYNFTGDKSIEGLVILDKTAFWALSDFLIVEIVR
jgi:hypothetical protein